MARDYRREYQARLARNAGKRASDAAGHAKRSHDAAARMVQRSRQRAEAARRDAAAKQHRAEMRKASRQATVAGQPVTVHRSASSTRLQSIIRNAAAAGNDVVIYTQWQTDTGVPDTHILGTGPNSGRHTHGAGDRTSDRPMGKVTIVEGKPDVSGGIAAADLAAEMDEYDDFFDFLADWFDDEDKYGVAR